MKRSTGILLLACTAVLLAVWGACDAASHLDGPAYARGGKIKYLNVDSLQVLPTHTELFTYDAALGVPPDSTQQVRWIVVYWDGDTPHLKRAEDGLLYRTNQVDGCLIDRPKPKTDGSDVVLVITNLETAEATDPVMYAGVPGLPICPR